MTTAFKCDICGEYFEREPDYKFKKCATENLFGFDGRGVSKVTWDICEACGEAVKSHMNELAKAAVRRKEE